jgi:hypothetical protein
MKKLIIGALLAAASSGAFATNWVTAAEAQGNNQRMSYDADSIKHDGDFVSLWVRYDYGQPTNIGLARPVQMAMAKWTLNCAKDTYIAHDMNFYDAQNALIQQPANAAQATPVVAVAPGTMNQLVEQAVCKR